MALSLSLAFIFAGIAILLEYIHLSVPATATRGAAMELAASAFMAASATTLSAFVISFFLFDGRRIPDQFTNAAKNELDTVRYYRDSQEVLITFEERQDDNVITIAFSSRLVPTKDKFFVEYPEIKPPTSFPQLSAPTNNYFINRQRVEKFGHTVLDSPSTDSLQVSYTIGKDGTDEYSDGHVWISPVLYYDVYFRLPQGFECHLYELMGSKPRRLERSSGFGPQYVHYPHRDAAFSGQGFEWRISKSARASQRSDSTSKS
jgi:hypothetical protein